MRSRLLSILAVSGLFLTRLYAQAPVISYTPATNVYTVNTAITSLTPTNTGGAVVAGSLGTFAALPGQPYGISYDPTTGDIITNNFSGGLVYVYSPAGVLLTTHTVATNGPKDIVVDASGNIYQADQGSGTIYKITPAGVITQITGPGMSIPDGMAIDAAGNIYAADQSSGDVYKIAPGATVATVYASGLTNSYGITINNATGDVYVSEFSPTNNIIKIASGTLTKTVFASGFSNPRNLIIDAAGNVYLADLGANSIIKITPAGVTSTFLTGLSSPRSMVIDPFGDIYIANSSGSDVLEVPTAGYSIDLPLPAGMSFNTTTGVISGTPTATLPTTVYTIAAHNGLGTGYTTETITVRPIGPTGTPDFNCGVGTVNLSASGGLPAGGTYNWYAAASGGTSLSTGATYNPSINSTTTFYVDYTQGGVLCAARTAVVGTISADPIISSAPTSGSYFSYGFTGGSTTDLSGSSNTATTHGAPTSTTDRYSTSGNAMNFVASSTQYISTGTNIALPGPSAFSISVWFKTSTAGGYLVGFGSSQTGSSLSVDRVIYMGTNGELYFGVAPLAVKSTINTITAYNDGNWHHVVATFSTTNGSNMYVDGALAASNPAMNAVLSLGGYWRIGFDAITGWTNAPATAAATYFNGALDDIAVESSELTAAQVNVLYGAGSGAFCSGNTLSLTANTVAGATYSWVGPAGSGFTSSSQNPTVPIANAIAGTYVLTVTNATGCQSTINVTAPGNVITYTWSGAAGTTNPTTAGNWDHLPLFSSTSNLVIPTGLAKYPVLTANESAYNVTLGATATLTLNGFTLSVGCDIVNNASTSGDGILYGGNLSSGITWNGSVAAQSYTGTNTTNTASLADMKVNNSAGGTVTINSGPVDIYDVITLTKGNLTVGSSPAALTLKCSSTQAASVAAIPSTYSVSGNVTVERYISGGSGYRSYRLLSSPVYNASPTASLNVYSLNYLQTGIYLTGTAGGGFDKTGNPTIYLYREDMVPSNTTFTSGNFWGISAINNSPSYNYYLNNGSTAYNLPAGTGVMFFFRGNRATTSLAAETVTTYTSPSAVTLSTTGTLNQGPILVKSWYNSGGVTLGYSGSGTASTTNYAVRGFNLVGNPYASSIDWSTFSNSSSAAAIYGVNIAPTVWIFNPHSKAYDTYNALTHIATGNASNIIPTGQGFFVQATAVSPTLTFQEAAKTSTQVASGNLLMDRRVALHAATAQGAYDSYLRLNLITDTANAVDMVVGFNSNTSTAYDQQLDAKFVKGSGSLQTLASISSDSVKTAVKWLPFPKKSLSQVIKLFVNASNYGTYTLQRTDFKAIPAIYDVWLMDNYKKDSLDIRNNTTYIFDITTDTNSYGGNRFTLVIRQNPALMVHLLQFNATKEVNGAQSVWATENEQNYTNFAIERSTDGGVTYNVLGGFASSGQGIYDFLDKNPVNGANLYRLQMTDLNGTITYSKAVTLMYGNTAGNLVKSGVILYPNPAKTTLNLNIAPGFNSTGSGMAVQNIASAKLAYNIQIVNILGVLVTKATTTTQNWQTDVNSLTPGTYVVKVVNSKDNSLVGESTFVKL